MGKDLSFENIKAPWKDSLGEIPFHLSYFDGTMYEKVLDTRNKYPNYISYVFFGRKTTYDEFINKVNNCAKALISLGVKPNDKVTICMPNCPQMVIMFYAVNKVGGISNMVSPLLPTKDIEQCVLGCSSKVVLTIDNFVDKFIDLKIKGNIKTLVVTKIYDELSGFRKIALSLKVKSSSKFDDSISWYEFLKLGLDNVEDYTIKRNCDDPAVILYTGGTTGKMKGVLLSNMNFNALAMQIKATNPSILAGDSTIAILPNFHGFCLGICIHTTFSVGGYCILVPKYSIDVFSKILINDKPNFLMGVPTLYLGLLKLEGKKNLDFSNLKGIYSGGDSFLKNDKDKINEFLASHGSKVRIREGYGATECVTATCLSLPSNIKEESIGVPLPDMYYKIVEVGTTNEVPYGYLGEICITGPTLMLGYLNEVEETNIVMKKHMDGHTWIHTGDLGSMDSDGFLYFKQRIKRVIVSSGYNIYPSQIEIAISENKYVKSCCVIGVPDKYKIKKVKAFIVLKDNVNVSKEEAKLEILNDLKEKVSKNSLPEIIEFREELPKTHLGKVAYRMLEEEEEKK